MGWHSLFPSGIGGLYLSYDKAREQARIVGILNWPDSGNKWRDTRPRNMYVIASYTVTLISWLTRNVHEIAINHDLLVSEAATATSIAGLTASSSFLA